MAEEEMERSTQNVKNLWALCTNNQNLIRDVLQNGEDPVETGKSLLLQIIWELEQEVEDMDMDTETDGYHPESKSSRSSVQFKQWIDNVVESGSNGKKGVDEMSEMSKLFENYHHRMSDNQNELRDIQNTVLELAGGHPGLMEICGRDGVQNPDGFMYSNLEDFEAKTGTRSRAKCLNCGSTNTKQISLISHSCSFAALQQLFTLRLMGLKGKKLLDIGSGMGSILYAAYCLSEASQITGIELNQRFCDMVSKIITTYGLDRNNRMRVVQGDLKDFPNLIQECDVVIFNNAFEYFVPRDVQIVLWQFIKSNLKSGSILVTNPSLVDLFTPLQPQLGIVIEEWVSHFTFPPGEEAYQKSVALTVIPKPDETFHIYNII